MEIFYITLKYIGLAKVVRKVVKFIPHWNDYLISVPLLIINTVLVRCCFAYFEISLPKF